MPKHDRLVNWLVVALVASTFGPYLVGGIRTEQALLYPLAMALVLLAPWTWLRWRPTVIATNLLSVWIVYAAAALVGLFGVVAHASWPPGPVWAGVDNLLLPLAVMLVVWLVITPERRDHTLYLACATVAWLAAINGVVAAVNTRVDLSGVLRPFWARDADAGTGITVAERAAQLGRFTGVFNQPVEAGLMYGLAGLAVVYAYRDRQRLMFVLLVPVFLGGALSVSKVFLLGGAPLILWQVWRTARSRPAVALAGAIAFLALAQSRLLQQWSGAEYLQRLIRPGQTGYVDLYTAGRLGETSTLSSVISEVMDRAPVLGFGARGLRAAYDNGWVAALVVAGVVGAVLYTLILGLLLLVPLALHGPQRRLAWGVALLAVVASVGLPALTANRAGTMLWLLVALLAVRAPSPSAGGELVAEPGVHGVHGVARVGAAGTDALELDDVRTGRERHHPRLADRGPRAR